MEASVGTKALPAPMMEGQAEESMDVQEEDAPMGRCFVWTLAAKAFSLWVQQQR